MPVVQSVLGGVRCEAHQQADFRRAVGRQMSPYDLPIGGIRPQKRASPRRRSRPRHCARCRFGCVPATRRVLPGDAAAAAAARRPARPFAGLPGHCSGKAASSPTAMPNRRCLRARGTYVLLYIYVLYVLPCSAAMRRACPVCCGTSVLPAELPDNGSGSAASFACDGGVGANHRHRDADRGPPWRRLRCLRERCLNVDGHPIYLVVFVADGGLQKRGQTGIERAGLLEVQGAFLNLIQLAEHMAGQRIAVLAHQADPSRQPKHDENAPGRLYPALCPSGVEVR